MIKRVAEILGVARKNKTKTKPSTASDKARVYVAAKKDTATLT